MFWIHVHGFLTNKLTYLKKQQAAALVRSYKYVILMCKNKTLKAFQRDQFMSIKQSYTRAAAIMA